ncbi:MAG TPA: tyrosine-protein phosphatase [Acidimicrobiia bacterium]|nr:tyrosine-protein phosphatase [Acidimicrobiia bacterium]
MSLSDELGVSPERRIELAGPVNFRDLGGYAGAGGRHVRWRLVFRSDSLGPVTEDDAAHLVERLRLVTVIDLRSTQEVRREGRGALVNASLAYHHLPLFEVIPGVDEEWPGSLHDLYRDLLRDASQQVAAVLRIIAEADTRPVVFHCVAGKDRTGVVAAVLLGLLGVSDEDVIADYALTQEIMPTMFERWNERPDSPRESDFPAHILRAEETTMHHLLAIIEEEYGSIAGYAASGGIRDDVVTGLRDVLLD